MIIARFGIRPAPSKIEAITQLFQPSTMEEVPILLGMTDYLRKFSPNHSSFLPPISNLFRDSRFRSKKSRRFKISWDQAQIEAVEALLSLLTPPPTLALPAWKWPRKP